jgi:hypothetical protein
MFFAIRCIDCIKPIVVCEACTCVVLKYIQGNYMIKTKLTLRHLQKCDILRICQAHSILKAKRTTKQVVWTYFILNNS